MTNLKVQRGGSLADFLSPKLDGSTLSVRRISETELFVESDEIVQIHISIDKKSKSIVEDVFSPKWGRPITVQQIDGSEFLEFQAEEELQREDFEELAEDILLAFSLISSWAKANKLSVIEQKTLPESPVETNEPPD